MQQMAELAETEQSERAEYKYATTHTRSYAAHTQHRAATGDSAT